MEGGNNNKRKPFIALSLGGGGAKTFAHLGVLDALKENNISVDYLTTCSAASVVGFLYGVGLTSQEIKKEFYKKRNWLGLIKRSIFKQVLEKVVKEKGIKDLKDSKIPISIITVDLKTGKEIVFEEGDPISIPLASAAFPGIWQPIKYKNYYLIDGGVLNPDPADIARKKVGEDGIVISVSLKLNFVEEKPKGRFTNLLKAVYLAPLEKREKILRENSDLILTPLQYLKVSFSDWKETFIGYFLKNKMEEFYREGYELALKEVPKIKSLLKEKSLPRTTESHPAPLL